MGSRECITLFCWEQRRAWGVLSAAEELLAEEANYGFVVAFLEDVQNLVSHRIAALCPAGEITARLGPRCT
jgi:hypothetical protein